MKGTANGLVTIPARIRKYLGLGRHSEANFRISNGVVVVIKREGRYKPGGRFDASRGVLKGSRTTKQWMHATRGR